MMIDKVKAKIGMVNFINTAPLYETWKTSVVREEWQVVEANPLELNKKLAAGELDLGFISSHEYAVCPQKYRLLKGLSISATGAVGSVFLFSQVEIGQLTDKMVCLSRQSQTSNSLVKIILSKFYQVRPQYAISSSIGVPDENEQTLLAIGDRALRIKESGRYPIVLDLGEIWQKQTGLPFVFAVWAVRDDFYKKNYQTVLAIHRELLRCVDQGKKNLESICQLAAPRIPMAVDKCYDYLKAIEYDLAEDKVKALELFYKYLIEFGEGTAKALPIRFA